MYAVVRCLGCCVVVAGLAHVTLAEDWAQFRGTNTNGVAPAQSLPQKWSENVAWKKDLPGRGASSPIVVGRAVIVTSASGPNRDRLHVLAFDADSGEQLWRRQVWATGRTFCHPTSSVAAPTPASDGKQIYAFYSSNDLVCLDLDGNLKWYRGLGLDHPKAGNDVGMASSPLVVGGLVVVQIESQGDAFAAAIDTKTGKTRWSVPRTRQANWCSPIALRDDNGQAYAVALQSPDRITAHALEDGKQLWEYKAACAGIASSVARDDLVYVPSVGTTALRVSPGSSAVEVVWSDNRIQPSSASAVVYRDNIYAVNRTGVLVAANAATGEVEWRLRLKGRFWATPIASGDYLYLVNSDGLAFVVELGDEGKIVAQTDLQATLQGTPAVADGAVFVRSDAHLWRIGK